MSQITNEDTLVKSYTLTVGKALFYKNYLVIEVAEGAFFDFEKAKELSLLTKLHFKNEPFGYISNRIHSYSLQPTDYMRIKEVFPNIKVFAVVTYSKMQKASISVENMFFTEGIKTFTNLEMAKKWVKDQLI